MNARIYIVNDHESQTRTVRPETFTNLTRGRVGVWARPTARNSSWLAADILTAFGVLDGFNGNGRPGEANLDQVKLWARVHDVDTLYVQNAFLLPAAVLTELLETTLTVPWDIWLVGDTGYSDFVESVVTDFCRNHHRPAEQHVEPLALIELAAQADASTSTLTDVATSRPWPTHLPTDDFTTFRAACRDRLDAKDFAVVDALYVEQVANASAIARGLPSGLLEREETLASWLHQQWRAAATIQQYIVTIRATQVALFTTGLFLKVDLDRLIGTAAVMPHEALRSPEPWRKLAAYAAPTRGAVCALSAAGLTVRDLRAVNIAHVAPDGSTVQGPRGVVEVFEPARVFVRGQLLQRAGAALDEPLFVNRRGGPESEPQLARYLTDARRELGVAVAASLKERDPVTGSRWMTRWGLSLKDLT